MKVLLVRPISNTYIISPPIGLGYLATALRKAGHEVNIIDCIRDSMGFDAFEAAIRREKPDIVGIQVWSCDVANVQKSLAIIKSANKAVITIVGGAHPSGVLGDSLIHFKDADYAYRGEGEKGLPMFIDRIAGRSAVKFEDIPGLIWREGGKIKCNDPILVDDLDGLGLPAWDLIDPRTYPEAPHQGFMKAFPIAPIFTTRGCPFSCTFCATRTITGRKIRYRSTDSIIEEIKLLREKYGVKEIHVEDDNFTMDREFVRRFCQGILDDKIDVYWYCSSGLRLDSLDEEMLTLMKKARCYTLTVAIESGSQRVLDLMKKSLKIDDVRKGVKVMNKVGYKPTGLFMIGFPGETRAEMEETVRFAMELNLKRAQFAIFHPLPGTEIYDELKAKGELKELDWSKLKPSEAAYVYGDMSAKELKKFQRKAFLKFHLRPKILYYQLREIRSLQHLFFLAKRVVSMLSS
ncbi:MAG: radical SAM protein [Candidatus Omnitrophota bacterium]|jgi:radical SAM superfamily enzyme YgiQ (UPF0313 family)